MHEQINIKQIKNMHITPRTGKIASAVLVGGLALLGLAGPAARADTPGAHPHYIHALSDLRGARAFLTAGDEQNVEQDAGAAIIEIDQSLGALRRAAAGDDKDVNAHFPLDARLSHRDRLGRALALLDKARADISRPESDPAALRFQHDAIVHVDRAYGDTERAIQADYHDDHHLLPGSHPHFLRAISDLRAARGLLDAPDEGNVVADERAASRSLTTAIRSARQGAIDDGLDIFSSPPPANNLPRHDRLVQARKLILDARGEETNSGETDLRAYGPLRDAVAATDRAVQQVTQAIRDDHNDDRFDRH